MSVKLELDNLIRLAQSNEDMNKQNGYVIGESIFGLSKDELNVLAKMRNKDVGVVLIEGGLPKVTSVESDLRYPLSFIITVADKKYIESIGILFSKLIE